MQEIVTKILIDIAIALMGVVAAYLTLLFNKARKKLELQIEKITSEKERVLIRDALDSLHVIAARTITKIEQTTAEKLRQEVKAGRINQLNLIALADQAHEEIVSTLKPQYREMLEKEFRNFSAYVDSLIEDKVYEIKKYGLCSTN